MTRCRYFNENCGKCEKKKNCLHTKNTILIHECVSARAWVSVMNAACCIVCSHCKIHLNWCYFWNNIHSFRQCLNVIVSKTELHVEQHVQGNGKTKKKIISKYRQTPKVTQFGKKKKTSAAIIKLLYFFSLIYFSRSGDWIILYEVFFFSLENRSKSGSSRRFVWYEKCWIEIYGINWDNRFDSQFVNTVK